MFASLVVISFPPVLGYSWAISICGFAYGIRGFFIAGPGALTGAMITFIVLRQLFQDKLKAWSRQNRKWQSMEEVIVSVRLSLPRRPYYTHLYTSES